MDPKPENTIPVLPASSRIQLNTKSRVLNPKSLNLDPVSLDPRIMKTLKPEPLIKPMKSKP